MERELGTLKIQLESEIWSHLGFNRIEWVEAAGDRIIFYLRWPIAEVGGSALAAFLAGVARLVGIESNEAGRRIRLELAEGKIVIRAPDDEE